ncbi:AAA family ATPase, partial [Desulfobacterota bacterium AH_259_B03_O07]|nr:AAA family ATPase [Desulfobacterota bacterium AH_259_B03_O07]
MYKRSQIKILKSRINEKRKFIQAVLGPRQVGKTTLVKQLLEKIRIPFHYASADAVTNSDTAWIDQQWDIARLRKKSLKAKDFLLVIDEIQKINEWSEAIKTGWDRDSFENNQIKLIILGSSRLIIQKGLTESLAGRFEVVYLNHWSFSEMNKAFGFTPDQFAWFGGYPGSAELAKDEGRWKAYIKDSMIETTISKDILMLTRIDKPALMKRLFELSCYYSGQILSYNKMLGQLQDAGNTTTLSHYLDLLDSAGLVTGLEKFSKEKVRKRASSPKIQIHNSALISSQLFDRLDDIRLQPQKWGRIVESAIGAHLINGMKRGRYDLSYWRHRNDEIDYVLERSGKIVGLEI